MAAKERRTLTASWTLEGADIVVDDTGLEIMRMLEHCLELVEVTDGGWTQLLTDRESGDFWELTYPQGEMHGGGPQRLSPLEPHEIFAKYNLESNDE